MQLTPNKRNWENSFFFYKAINLVDPLMNSFVMSNFWIFIFWYFHFLLFLIILCHLRKPRRLTNWKPVLLCVKLIPVETNWDSVLPDSGFLGLLNQNWLALGSMPEFWSAYISVLIEGVLQIETLCFELDSCVNRQPPQHPLSCKIIERKRNER